MKMDKHINDCWCGNKELQNYNEDYSICNSCNSLVLKEVKNKDFYLVNEDENDFYGKNYWIDHMKKDYGFPDIFELSRTQLYERCLHWLKSIMKYRLPTAKSLELGCSHGGLVYLMNTVGYEAAGTEMSPWICNYAETIFNNKMYIGDISQLDIVDYSLDIIILMDVLEHLPSPKDTIAVISRKLKEDGILVIQTPCYRNKSYEDLIKDNDLFKIQLKEEEHLFLFSEQSITKFLMSEGFNFINFEKQLFEYDMFLFASKKELKVEEQTPEDYLMNNPHSRSILALLDLFEEKQIIDRDREERLKLINKQAEIIQEKEKEVNEIQIDREERLKIINKQVDIIEEKEKEIDEIQIDREERLKIINKQVEIIKDKEKLIEELRITTENQIGIINEYRNYKIIKILDKIKKKKIGD